MKILKLRKYSFSVSELLPRKLRAKTCTAADINDAKKNGINLGIRIRKRIFVRFRSERKVFDLRND